MRSPTADHYARHAPARQSGRWLAGVFLAALAATSCASQRGNALPGSDAELVSKYPCPTPIPPSWVAADSTLGLPPGCALVVAALNVVTDATKQDTTLARVASLPLDCVRARRVAYEGSGVPAVGTNWTVEFYRSDTPRVLVVLAPAGGTSSARLVPSPSGVSAMALCEGG